MLKAGRLASIVPLSNKSFQTDECSQRRQRLLQNGKSAATIENGMAMAYAEDGGCGTAVAPPPPPYSTPVCVREGGFDRRRRCCFGVEGCCLTMLIMVVIAFLGGIAGGVA